jgi:hypothetical protein
VDIQCDLLRDRRIAASDETVSVRGANSRIYRQGSVAREHGAQGASAPGRRSPRYDRQPGDIRAIVLHQTAGASFISGRAAERLSNRSADSQMHSSHRIDRIAAHFVVLQDGTIFYTHDVQFLIDSAGGRHGIDIEVAGRFPASPTPDPTRRLPAASIRALRGLVAALQQQLPTLTHIHPHGQIQSVDTDGGIVRPCGGPGSANPASKLISCPGPDIWVNVGMWACRDLGLVSDNPLPPYRNNGIHPRLANLDYLQTV